jgi:hypothetical protein
MKMPKYDIANMYTNIHTHKVTKTIENVLSLHEYVHVTVTKNYKTTKYYFNAKLFIFQP